MKFFLNSSICTCQEFLKDFSTFLKIGFNIITSALSYLSQVMGIWLLGAGVPFRYKPSPRAVTNSATPATHNHSSSDPNTTRSADLLACPSERIARCFPVKLAVPPTVNSAVASDSPQGKCSWLLPLPHAQHSNSQDHDHHLVRVIEQFLCIANSTTRFQSEIENSRQLVEAAELEAETLGPRSIAQVRREKMLQLSQSSSSADNIASGAVKAPESAQDLANGAAGKHFSCFSFSKLKLWRQLVGHIFVQCTF